MENDYPIEKEVSINISVKCQQDDTMISCFIPEINVHFSAKTWEGVNKKASALTKAWIKFFNEENQK